MAKHIISTPYRQFYVADAVLEPEAPEVWSNQNVEERHNTQKHIVALCPDGDITARIYVTEPGEEYLSEESSEFQVNTEIEIPSGHMGIYGYPWELHEEFEVQPGTYTIQFKNYCLDKVETEGDYYSLEISMA